ncbi:S8/S53 family peptidase [Asanoa siamensis]|uniref:Peptidase S8/S53 domain-containing protein n=1 Tax=Asanoa siamensis TaxID=926357 RepID=A0ABQ4CMC7_9ACTN|nr:S8/S53 family peptidase [Asanoa siamensis]GIF72420.1 hypothetical protein Asi02nite_19380 [Asanoa siamensis]
MPKRNPDDEWSTREERAHWPVPETATTVADAQVGRILRECGRYLEPGPPGWERDGIRYFVRRGFVLVPDEHAERARRLLVRAGMRPPPSAPPDVESRTVADPSPGHAPGRWDRPPPRPLGGPRLDGDTAYGVRWLRLNPLVSVFDALRVLRDGRWAQREPYAIDDVGGSPDEGIGRAGAEHLLHLADHTKPCPAEEPRFVAKGTPPDPPVAADPHAGRGIRVLVVDTGFDPRAEKLPWLKDVVYDPDPGVKGKVIERYAGHGTFIAGVVRTVAPAAEVVVRAGLPAAIYGAAAQTPLGSVFEGDLAHALERYLLLDAPDIISLSAGTLGESPEGLMLLESFHRDVLRRHKGVVVVAAAGNDGGRAPFWPAASPWTVGVGALSANWRHRAQFSNFGAWVDVYAPGEHLTNAFPRGTYTYFQPPHIGGTQVFEGMAVWSGTSFSTPVMAGLIAARMSRTGENGPDAAAALIAQGRRDAVAGVGAVLLP